MFALLAVVLGATAWPVRPCCALPLSLGSTLINDYPVAFAVLALILGSAAIGTGLLLAAPTLRSPRGGGSTTARGARR